MEITRSTSCARAGGAALPRRWLPRPGQTIMPGKMQSRPIPRAEHRCRWSVAHLEDLRCRHPAKGRAPLAEVLRILFEAGGSWIDSSPMYGAA